MSFLKSFFASKRVGFYLGFLSGLLILTFFITFVVNYGNSVYMDTALVIFPILGFAIFACFSFYRPIEGIGSMLLSFFCMESFCVFMYRTYGYLSEVFFAGINADAFAAMKPQYALCTILLILALVLSIASIFCVKSVDKKADSNQETEEK